MKPPLVVSYGGGVNSTALLIGLAERAIAPDLILFADTGSELPETYDFIDTFNLWLEKRLLPPIIRVSNAGTYESLEDDCLKKNTLPSLAFGFKGCSVKWKRQPMDRYIRDHYPQATLAWNAGLKVRRAIGIDAGEAHRGQIQDDNRFTYEFPLIEWDWAREECLEAIDRASLPRPAKSACFFCPATKKHEILSMRTSHPSLLNRALRIERNCRLNGQLVTSKGLGRSYSWEELIKADEMQLKLFKDADEIPCMCFDGDNS